MQKRALIFTIFWSFWSQVKAARREQTYELPPSSFTSDKMQVIHLKKRFYLPLSIMFLLKQPVFYPDHSSILSVKTGDHCDEV